jgi:hypothetical protein
MAWPLAIFERTGTKIEEKREKKKKRRKKKCASRDLHQQHMLHH